MKYTLTFFLTVFIILLALTVACDKKPTEPTNDNPFDIENTETGGDPFQLSAIIANGGITLNWNKPDFENLQSFRIYRSENETSGYAEIGTATAIQTQYVDKKKEGGPSS